MILKKGEVDKIWPDSFTNSWREWVWTILLLFIQMWSHSWISRRAMRKWWTTTGGGEKKSQYINLKFYLNFVPFPFNILLTWQQIHWISTSNWNYYYESFWTPPPPLPPFPLLPCGPTNHRCHLYNRQASINFWNSGQEFLNR